VPYPENPNDLNDREWAEYLFYRDNTKGTFAERWLHSTGCRQWFNMLRDTVTYDIQAVYPMGVPRPDAPFKVTAETGTASTGAASTTTRLSTSTTSIPAPPPRRSNQVTSQNARLSAGGRIDRTISWRFTVDGEEFTGHPGDTLASALLANGRIAAGNSLYEDRARGIMSAGVEEPNALVRIEARFPGDVAESMLPATTVTLVDGLKAEYLNGLGKLDPADDRAEYDKKYVHTDILVIGGGPAGLAAAREAVRSGARVMLLDDQPELGGSLLSGSTAPDWLKPSKASPPWNGWPTLRPSSFPALNPPC
jgi:heterotetrameric sarcosine oxidase delta subunit